ncbi:MAG: class I SAM-dependent methyltransferase [Nonlabens sp.]
MFFSTEITSRKHASDLPMLLRTSKAYEKIEHQISGRVLEIGCGEGYGLDKIYRNADQLFLYDKSKYSQRICKRKFPNAIFINKNIDDIYSMDLGKMDHILCFQFIEHIQYQKKLIDHLVKMLKPGGKLYISTPNKCQTLIRNPWHLKELDEREFKNLVTYKYYKTSIEGLFASDNLLPYYASNRSNVSFLNKSLNGFLNRLPGAILKIPYEVGNRINRNRLLRLHSQTINNLSKSDYYFSATNHDALDLFATIYNPED